MTRLVRSCGRHLPAGYSGLKSAMFAARECVGKCNGNWEYGDEAAEDDQGLYGAGVTSARQGSKPDFGLVTLLFAPTFAPSLAKPWRSPATATPSHVLDACSSG